jgi:hypothetical protein
MTTLPKKQRIEINREALKSLREDGVRGALALNVDKKIRQGAQLTKTESRVLWLGITQEQVRFVKKNLL